MTQSNDNALKVSVGLLDWLANPSVERGISYVQDRGDWERVTYSELAAKVFDVARELDTTNAEGAIVPILMPPGPRFVAAFFAVLLVGGIPAPLAAPGVFDDQPAYDAYLAHLLATASTHVIVAEAKYEKRILDVVSSPRPRIVVVDEGFSATSPFSRSAALQADDIALLQFSSGSSGKNRAVRVPVGSLEANTNAISEWLHLTSDRDAWATWLPVHHDMGLIAGIVTPVMHSINVWAMPPTRFIKEPLKWLSCFGQLGATVTAVPTFGLRHIVRKVTSSDVRDMDFTGWKALVCGAERVSAEALRDFAQLVGPSGFDEKSILPAYGMAEATLAVTGKKIGATTKAIRVAPAALRMGLTVEPSGADDGNWHVGCGTAVDPGTTVHIVQEGAALGDGVVGEIAVSGSSVAAGYHSNTTSSTSRFEDDMLFTGDAGFLYDGELFIVGRMGDSVKLRGVSVFAEDTDASLHSVPGLGTHNAVTLLGLRDDRESIIALVEKPPGEWVLEVGRHLESQYPSMRVVVIASARGSLMRTTSGKPRRTAMWQQVLDRWDASDVAFDSDNRQLSRKAGSDA